MARAAVKLSIDISPYLPALSRKIQGFALYSESGQAAFRKDKSIVVLYPKEINIFQVENEAEARDILEWISQMMDQADE
jgi:ArsR family metal-binding transcriptional regulator